MILCSTGLFDGTADRLQVKTGSIAAFCPLLAAAGAPTEPEEIGISRSRLRESVMKAVKIRRRFTILDLGLRCGLLEKWTEKVFGEGGVFEIAE